MDSEQTIEKYCGNIKERILACRTKTIAFALKDRLCSELQLNCESRIINNILNAHVDQIIGEIFDQDGKNKFMETPHDVK